MSAQEEPMPAGETLAPQEFDPEGSAIRDPRDPLWTNPSACLWSDRVVLIQIASLVSIFALDPMFAE